MVSNSEVDKGDSVSFTIAATPDNFPSISVEQIQDEVQKDFAIFLGAVSDDYGLSRLEFHYVVKDEKGTITAAKNNNCLLQINPFPILIFRLIFQNTI